MNNNIISLLGATFATRNMGVSALTAGSMKCMIQKYPDADLFLLDYGKKRLTYEISICNRSVSVKLLNMRFSKKIYLKNNIALLILISLVLKIIPFQIIRDKIISSNFFLNHICESKIVAAISGGDSFSDIYGLRRFLYVSMPQLLVLFMGKKLILLPQTLGPFKGSLTKAIAKYILTKAHIIYSRDFVSLQEMKQFLKLDSRTTKLRFCYDVGFVLDPVKPVSIGLQDHFEGCGNNTVSIGLNVSGLLYAGGYTQNNMFKLKVNYGAFIYKVIDYLCHKENVNILLIPHVFGDSLESDIVACRAIYDNLKEKYKGRLFFVDKEFDQGEIKYIIGLCDFFIGSRMHACIAALSQSIPAVSIAYSKKFFGVMQTIGMESLVIDPRYMEEDDMIGIISKVLNTRSIIHEALKKKMPHVKSSILDMINHINNFNE